MTAAELLEKCEEAGETELALPEGLAVGTVVWGVPVEEPVLNQPLVGQVSGVVVLT